MKIVFVHGALVFDGAWWWHRMVEPLAALGLGSRAVELPTCVPSPGVSPEAPGDMYADADAVRAALDEEDEPLVLVGHSYGGMVITDAAADQENVAHLSRSDASIDLFSGEASALKHSIDGRLAYPNPSDPLKELASLRKGGRWPLLEVGFQQRPAVVVYLRAHTGPLLRTERISLARCPDIALDGGEA